MNAIPDHAEIYRKLHANRWDHVEQARRARDMQAALEPFARWANEVKGSMFFASLPDDHIMTTTGDGRVEKWIYMRDLRRAREAINGQSRT